MANCSDTSETQTPTWSPAHQSPPAAGRQHARYLLCPRPLWWCGCCRMTPGETQGDSGSEGLAQPVPRGLVIRGLGRCPCRTPGRGPQAAGVQPQGSAAQVPRADKTRSWEDLLRRPPTTEEPRPREMPGLLVKTRGPQTGRKPPAGPRWPRRCDTSPLPGLHRLPGLALGAPRCGQHLHPLMACCPSDTKPGAIHLSPSSQEAYLLLRRNI